jgi:hypothetical protein
MIGSANGKQGTVKYGPVPAATLKSWRIDRVEQHDRTKLAWTLTATPVSVNAFYITQTPLQLSLRMGSRNWRWSDVVLEVVGGQLRGTLTGRPEVR